MQLSRPVKVLLGVVTVWVILYPLVFVVAIVNTFFGILFTTSLKLDGFFTAFFALAPLHAFTIILWPVLASFYAVYIRKNNIRVETGSIILRLGLFLLPSIVMPFFYFRYIWPDVQTGYREANEIEWIESVGQGNITEFRPSLIRFVLSCTVLCAAFVAITFPAYALELSGGDFSSIVIKLFAFIAAVAVLSPVLYTFIRAQITIAITDQEVFKSHGLFRKRIVALPIEEVDLVKSRKYATSQSMIDSYYIESVNNQRIGVNQFIYTKQQFHQMLDAIENNQASGTTF